MSRDFQQELVDRLTAITVPTISPAAVQSLAEQEFRGGDDTVAATVNGAGELLRLEVSALATRGDAREQVGAQVCNAVNDALAQVEVARQQLLPGQGDLNAKLDQLTAAFNARMDGLLGRLDQIGASLPPPAG